MILMIRIIIIIMIMMIIWGSCLHCRHHGDVRVKVGSERKVASSPARAQTGCRRDRYASNTDYARGDPPKLALLAGNILRQSSWGTRGICCWNRTHSRIPSRFGVKIVFTLALWLPRTPECENELDFYSENRRNARVSGSFIRNVKIALTLAS